MRFNVLVSNEGSIIYWKEEYNKPSVTSFEEAEKFGKDVVEFYNVTLRPHEKPRAYVGVEILPDLPEQETEVNPENFSDLSDLDE